MCSGNKEGAIGPASCFERIPVPLSFVRIRVSAWGPHHRSMGRETSYKEGKFFPPGVKSDDLARECVMQGLTSRREAFDGLYYFQRLL